MSSRAKALVAYRGALRAIGTAFQGDLRTITAARQKLRNEMKAEKSSEHPEFTAEQRIELLNQVSTFLKRNIVQGVKNGGQEKYELRIHKETELGDNDELRKKKSTLSAGASAAGGCCGNGMMPLKERR